MEVHEEKYGGGLIKRSRDFIRLASNVLEDVLAQRRNCWRWAPCKSSADVEPDAGASDDVRMRTHTMYTHTHEQVRDAWGRSPRACLNVRACMRMYTAPARTQRTHACAQVCASVPMACLQDDTAPRRGEILPRRGAVRCKPEATNRHLCVCRLSRLSTSKWSRGSSGQRSNSSARSSGFEGYLTRCTDRCWSWQPTPSRSAFRLKEKDD